MPIISIFKNFSVFLFPVFFFFFALWCTTDFKVLNIGSLVIYSPSLMHTMTTLNTFVRSHKKAYLPEKIEKNQNTRSVKTVNPYY